MELDTLPEPTQAPGEFFLSTARAQRRVFTMYELSIDSFEDFPSPFDGRINTKVENAIFCARLLIDRIFSYPPSTTPLGVHSRGANP